MDKRRWYRLHWGTWLAVLGATVLLAYCQVPYVLGEAPLVNPGWERINVHGWPLLFAERATWGSSPYGGSGSRRFVPEGVEYEIAKGPLCWNIGAWATILMGTLVAFEVWLRRSRRFQLRLADLFALIAVAAVLLGWWYQDYHKFDRYPESLGETFRAHSRSPFLGRWITSPVRVPLIFSLGCTVYTAGWLGFQCLRAGIRRRIGPTTSPVDKQH